MSQIDRALEYFHYLARGGKYSGLKYDDIFVSLQSVATRRGLSNQLLRELVPLWMQIKIPLSKWSSLGHSLVPEGRVSDDVVHTTMRWILVNYLSEKNHFKVVPALNWLLGLLDHNLVNPEALDLYYEFYFAFLYNDKYLIPSSKIIYNLTKSQDVNRCKVNSLIKLMDKKRSSRHYNCLVTVLGLFKSYRPECVPEEVPNVSVSVAFAKLNKLLVERLEQAQIRSNIQLNVLTQKRLVWWTAEGKSNHFTKKKHLHLVPDLEYLQLGALIYTANGKQRKCFEFTSIREVLVFHYGQPVEIPANILSLLVNDAGLHILQFSDGQSQARFSYVLYHTLHTNFLNSNPDLSYNEKRHFLKQVAKLQNRLMQGIPVVSRFLSQYISTWNGTDFLDEILELLEWIVFESFVELYDCVLEHIECLYLTSETMYRCSLLRVLGKMYINVHDIMTTRRKLLFLNRPDELDSVLTLNNLFNFIDELCNKTLDSFPDDTIMRHCLLNLYESLSQVHLHSDLPLWNVLPATMVYNVLCSFNGFSINKLLGILLRYTSIYEKIKSVHGKGPIKTQINLVDKYTTDLINCLWYSKAISWRNDGIALNSVPKKVAKYLEKNADQFDKYLDITNHFAFTMKHQRHLSVHTESTELEKDLMLKTSVTPYFNNFDKFISTAVEHRRESSC